MFRQIQINNFRGFESFELPKLGRLNLLVGKNNSGKTSILEAIQLLNAGHNLDPLKDIMLSRGEYLRGEDKQELEVDIQHLFYGHQWDIKSELVISGYPKDGIQKQLTISIKGSQKQLNIDEQNDQPYDSYDLVIKPLNGLNGLLSGSNEIPLSIQGGLNLKYLRSTKSSSLKNTDSHNTKQQFITSSSLTADQMIELFDQVVLTPQESLILEALQTIDPNIQRIAAVHSERYKRFYSRGGFVVRLANSDQRVPIGSMGDGIWRMLGLVLAIANVENGVFLIDEIDTGLHFSAMADMWKLLWETAKKLNVQVFATTHSRDCWESLATVASQEEIEEDEITIQRIEPNKNKAVVFTKEEMIIAANREIEVR